MTSSPAVPFGLAWELRDGLADGVAGTLECIGLLCSGRWGGPLLSSEVTSCLGKCEGLERRVRQAQLYHSFVGVDSQDTYTPVSSDEETTSHRR